ncbi:MAG: DNA polymerase IV [Lachnospiraceae bacterium]|nr:DNA polymerase IV [Lachnospiraceae bacterium]
MPERLIFHVDVNSAYLSWESVRRISEGKQDLREIPSAVGGEPGKRTGIILAKSIPAKKYGVTTGEPVSMALRKCPELVLVPPDFRLYEKNSRAFMEICRKYAPVLQKFSVDECFLDMTGTSLLYPDPIALAHRIKDEIRDTLGFTVNVGVGSNRLLAKMASDFEKPDKVHTLFLSEIREKMWPLPVGDLLYIGKMSAARLQAAGIRTIGDLACMNIAGVQAILGEKGGQSAWESANGMDDSPVTEEREEPKGYSISTTLEEDVTTLEQARHVLLMLADHVAGRMRADGAKAYCVAVDIRFSKLQNIHGNTPSTRFTNKSHQRKLESATDVTDEIYHTATELFQELWRGEPLRLMGIALSDLTKDTYEQTALFRDEKRERAKKLDEVMDKIRGKYGQGAVFRAGAGDMERIGRKTKAQMDPEDQQKEWE